ncbi:MAG: hypothetical protein HY040_07465 [Planctomycetes bacterium]|nr:hypothetical protein [Planctomycetota bacterium]
MHQQPTRRTALTVVASFLFGLLPGCQAAALVISLPWDRILSVLVLAENLVAIVRGLLNGAETETEIPLTHEQLRRLQNGEEVIVELRDGHNQRIRPTIES